MILRIYSHLNDQKLGYALIANRITDNQSLIVFGDLNLKCLDGIL